MSYDLYSEVNGTDAKYLGKRKEAVSIRFGPFSVDRHDTKRPLDLVSAFQSNGVTLFWEFVSLSQYIPDIS